MDTHASSPVSSSRRWLRVGFFVTLIVVAQGGLAFLLTWVDPPRDTLHRVVDLSRGHTLYAPDAWLAGHETRPDATKPTASKKDAVAVLAEFAQCGANQPAVLVIRAPAVQAESGSLVLLAPDTSSDLANGLRLREVLKALQACPSKQKLLVLDLAPPLPSAWRGYVHHDLGAAIARELDALPDPDRLVLCACARGQSPHGSPDFGASVFAHYIDEGLRGHADGYGDTRDGRITVKELAAFVQARVERWTWHNRGERQTPTLVGAGNDFVVASVDPTAIPEPPPAALAREYPEGLDRLWKERDHFYRTGPYRLASRRFQTRQAWLEFVARNDAAPVLAANLAWTRPSSGKAFDRVKLHGAMVAAQATIPENAKQPFEEKWRALQQQLVDARPADAERIKNRFVEQVHAKAPDAELDAVVFAHAVTDPHLDPGTLRLYDRLLHPAPQTLPRTAEGLRVRQLADLATRVDVSAWPRDVVEAFLRCSELGEKAHRQFPYMPGYVDMLDEPAQTRHDGEIRLLARGYANPDDAKKSLNAAAKQFAQLIAINERWRSCEQALDETLAELPWYFAALEAMPELREPWQKAAQAATILAESLEKQPADSDWWVRIERFHTQLDRASGALANLRQNQDALHAPFARDALARLERHCRAANADADTLRQTDAIMSVVAPIVPADQRMSLRKAANALSRRLNDDIMAQDRQDNELHRVTPLGDRKAVDVDLAAAAEWRARCHLALLALAGTSRERTQQAFDAGLKDSGNPLAWCVVGARCKQALSKDMPTLFDQEKSWRRRERLAWLMSPLEVTTADRNELSPATTHRLRDQEQQARWRAEHHRYLNKAYQSLNLESAGVMAARVFYSLRAEKSWLKPPTEIRFHVAEAVMPLSEKQPYANVQLEVTRQVSRGESGPVEIQVQRPDDVWLNASEGATLPALAESDQPRSVTQKTPIMVARLPRAERAGLPPPLGFLVEARCDGQTWHHLVTTPIVPNTQLVQLLVSTDADEPTTALNEIRVRPGQVKQPHYFYVKNLTNRVQKVHVEIADGTTVLRKGAKAIVLEPDAVRKIAFDEAAPTSVRGPLSVRVLDASRQKVLQERALRVNLLAPAEYVRVAEATYDPGAGGLNKWAVQVQAVRPIAGPAIAAQLVLPVQRIPGLLSVGGGTLHADVSAQAETSRVLFAENLRLINAGLEEGPVYLHIDGVPRAFVYRTRFHRAGDPVQAVPDDRPAVRIGAPPCVMTGVNCLVDIEADNCPPGTKLEVALGSLARDGRFKAELIREFTDAKKTRIDVEASKDALVFNGSIADWTATFDTRSIVGARDLQARLIAPGGKVIAQANQPLVLDDSPPLARIVPTQAQAKKGSILQVQAEGTDPESGVAQVTFFYGRPEKGEIPPSAQRFKAVPATRDQAFWMAALLVPADHKGPLAVSVQVVNHAGMASIDTVMVDVIDRDAGKNGAGEIRGRVTEGPRPQANLLVTLMDASGKEIARTRTQADGSYAFGQLTPGRYRVISVKPESQRRAEMNVTVEPNRATQTNLALSL